MDIEAVFFDMGGTLERVWYTPEQRLMAASGLRQCLLSGGIELVLSDQEFHQLVADGYKRYHHWSIETMEEISPLRVWSEFILAGQEFDQAKLARIAEDLMFFLETRFYERELRSEVPETLEAIRALGLKIGLISNVCSHGLVDANLKAYGIRNYFDPIILSSEYGRRKPDPAIFHHAARLANVPTGACMHIGDRIARDIVGARKAGYASVVQIINDFDHGEKDEGPAPDAVIHHFSELIPLVNAKMKQPVRAITQPVGIRAVLFDAGDILYYRSERGRNLQVFLEELGLADKEIPVREKNSLKRQVYHGHISQEKYRESFLDLYGITDLDLVECGKKAMDADDNNITFFKGVPETLRELEKAGFMLGVITDTAMPLYMKLKWFDRGGFGDVWDSIISSADLGVQKPAPRIYHAALHQLGISVDQAVFVGHLQEELDGAHAVGMKTIAFNYEKSAKADFYIDSFSDLLKVPILKAPMAVPSVNA